MNRIMYNIPFIIPMLGIINILISEISFSYLQFPFKEQINKIIINQYKVNSYTSIGYWIIFCVLSIVLIVILALRKKITIHRFISGIILNFICIFIVLYHIISSF